MRWLDRRLQWERVRRVRPYTAKGSRVLDIGCADGVLFRSLDDVIGGGVGIDEDVVPAGTPKYGFIQGRFPAALPTGERFDLVTALAVVEHVPEPAQPDFAAACFRALRAGGRIVMTIPSPAVDDILRVLKAVRVVDGMKDSQHFGFQPENAVRTFEQAGFKLERHSTFQMGLNHLLVFLKPAASDVASS